MSHGGRSGRSLSSRDTCASLCVARAPRRLPGCHRRTDAIHRRRENVIARVSSEVL